MVAMNTWERGQYVVVIDVNGYLLLRRLWSVVDEGVFILSDVEWSKRASGEPWLEPVGFPKSSVFFYNEETKCFNWEDGTCVNYATNVMTPFFHEIYG